MLGANGRSEWKQQAVDVVITLPQNASAKYAYTLKFAGEVQ
jgi:hypothetical protein